jgi:transposase
MVWVMQMEGMVENFAAMMAGSLGLTEPWYVERANFNSEGMAVQIYIGVRKTAAIACPVCGSEAKRYGYEKNERVWRHGDCLFYPCYVHCRRPKILCTKCGAKQVNAPFERKNSRFTLLFEGFAMMVLADAPVAKTAEWLRCDEKSLTKILRYWVNKAVDGMDLSEIAELAIDETSFKRGHKYVTLIIGAAKRRVIDVEEGRGKESVELFAKQLTEKGGDPEKITTVTSDMSKTYLPAIEENFPNAENIIDKFHVKKVLIDALDEVRKAEQKTVSDKQNLFRGRRLFMIPEAKLSGEQAAKIAEMSKRYPLTGRAYRIVAGLDDFYSSRTPKEAEAAFDSLYSWMRRCRLKPMKEAAATLMRHKDKILHYFKSRLTNAICEGINSMVQAAKRKARGFHTFEGYSSMIYLVAGKLQLAVPSPF